MLDDDLHRLVGRLRRLLTSRDGSQLVVLLGGGMTVPYVPGVRRLTQMAWHFADQIGAPPPRTEVNEPIAVGPDVQQVRIATYVEALQSLRDVRGRDGLRAVLQRASVNAIEDSHRPGSIDQALPDATYAELERSDEHWRITDGLGLLVEVLKTHGHQVQKYLLTTNFDPLLQVALRRAGLRINNSYAVSGPNDPMTGLHRDRANWTVVHLHGNCATTTVHDPVHLNQPHDAVEEWLAAQIRGNHLLVLGYSGWDGLIQRTLRRYFGRDSSEKDDEGVEVLWTVYESREMHPHADAQLADFFERYRMRGVSAYYDIDRDQLFRALSEELTRQVDGSAFYNTVKRLRSEYKFGHSNVRPETVPAFVFWPHRLRAPHLIHGVHGLAAVLLSRLGIAVELHLDDTEMSSQYAERTATEFVEAVNAWFEMCGAPSAPSVLRISELLHSADLPEKLWRLANELYSNGNSALDALVATKVVSVEADAVTVAPTPAHRILRPVYTWLALDAAIERHGLATATESTVVTLGGADEMKMWELFQTRRHTPRVANIFVPRLESPTDGANLWQYRELRRDTSYGARDLERFLVRSAASWPDGSALLEWVFTAANRLAVLASEGAVTGMVDGDGAPASWRSVSERMAQNPTETCATLAEIVATWFLP